MQLATPVPHIVTYYVGMPGRGFTQYGIDCGEYEWRDTNNIGTP